MRSVRLNAALEAQLEEAARVSGEPVSRIIRRAIESQCREILGEQLAPRLRDVIGVVESAGGRATPNRSIVYRVAEEKQGAAMILVDAGPLVALLDRGEQEHGRCVSALQQMSAPMINTWHTPFIRRT